MNKEDIKKIIKQDGISYIRMQFTDMLGDIKAVEMPVNRIDDALDNKIMFDGSSIEGFVRIKEADMYLRPDLKTFLVLPFEDTIIVKDYAYYLSSVAISSIAFYLAYYVSLAKGLNVDKPRNLAKSITVE